MGPDMIQLQNLCPSFLLRTHPTMNREQIMRKFFFKKYDISMVATLEGCNFTQSLAPDTASVPKAGRYHPFTIILHSTVDRQNQNSRRER
jgi:hypothetical protein